MFNKNDKAPWNAAAGTVFTGAAGYAFLKNKRAFQDAWSAGNTNVIGQTVAESQSMAGFNSVKNTISNATMIDETLQAGVSSFEKRIGTMESIANIHASTYQALMSGGALTHEDALGAMSLINKQGSATGAYKAGLAAVQKHSGNLGAFQSSIKGLTSNVSIQSSISSGGYGRNTRASFSDANNFLLSAEARKNSLRIQDRVKAAADSNVSLTWSYQNVEDILSGKKITTPMMIGTVDKSQIAAIPLANTGVTYGGKNLNTRYITRKAYDESGNIMSFPDVYEQSFVESIEKSKTNAQLKRNVLDANQRLIEHMNVRDSGNRAAAIWSSKYTTSGGLASARLTSQEAISYGANIKEDDVLNLLGRGLYPYTSPGAAGKGTLTTRNLAEDLFGPLGAFASASDRPTQFVRREWGVTKEAKSMATPFKGMFGKNYDRLDRKIQGSLYGRFMYGGQLPSAGEAYSAPQLMTFYAKPANKGYGLGYNAPALNQMLAGEEGVISNRVTGMMEYERILQKKITLDEGFQLNKTLKTALAHKPAIGETIPLSLGLDESFIGIEKGTGKSIMSNRDFDSMTTAIGAELTGPNEAKIYMRERRKLSSNTMWKFFSEENKYMAAAADENKMRSVLGAAGLGDTVSIAGQKVEAMFSGKLVGRNKLALLTQQIEATSMFVGHKMDTGMKVSQEALDFLADPTAALNVKRLLADAAGDADIQIQRNLIGMAKQWEFTQKEMQLTFGLTGEKELKSLVDMGALRPKEAYGIMQSPGVIGLGKGRLGDLAIEGGSGGFGSFEQSGFRALSMKGKTGQRYAAELSQRIVGKGELSAADKMAATITGQEPFFQKLMRKQDTVESLLSGDLIREEGRFVSIGNKVAGFGGSDTLYIPGMGEAPELMRDKIIKGEAIQTPLVKELNAFKRTVRDAATGEVSEAEFEMAADSLRNVATQQSENQAAAQGKIFGSKYLTGQRKNFTKDVDAFRISQKSGNEMFEDLMSRTQSQDQLDFLKSQQDKFRNNEIITGGMWRHPTTGPESFQFVKFRQDMDMVDNMIASPTKFGKMAIDGGAEMPIDVSEMVGFKGDFDRDQFTLSLIGDRRTSDQVRRKMANMSGQEYNQYLFNHYNLKDMMESKLGKKTSPNVLSPDFLREGFRKLTTAKTTTGQVNIAMQKLKLGLQYSQPDQYRPAAEMLYHLEEAVIGGKHGVLGADIYKGISESVQEGGVSGARKLEQVARSVFGDQPIRRTGSITDAMGNVTQHQFDFDPRRFAQTTMSSLDSIRPEVEGVMKAASAARGKNVGNVALEDAIAMFHSRRSGSVDVAQSVMQANADNVGKSTMRVSRAVFRGQTKARSLFGVFKRASKPLLAGAGLAAGIMLMSPSTASTVRNPEGVDGGRNLDPESYGPPGGLEMNPPTPRMNMSPKIYDSGGGRPVSHANIRMRTNDLDSSSSNFMRSARQLSNGSSVNIKTRDDRSMLDPRSLASKIHERL